MANLFFEKEFLLKYTDFFSVRLFSFRFFCSLCVLPTFCFSANTQLNNNNNNNNKNNNNNDNDNVLTLLITIPLKCRVYNANTHPPHNNKITALKLITWQ